MAFLLPAPVWGEDMAEGQLGSPLTQQLSKAPQPRGLEHRSLRASGPQTYAFSKTPLLLPFMFPKGSGSHRGGC